jgi:hypothetical protein
VADWRALIVTVGSNLLSCSGPVTWSEVKAAWSTGSGSGQRLTTAAIAPAMAPTPTAIPTRRPHHVLSQPHRPATAGADAGSPLGDVPDSRARGEGCLIRPAVRAEGTPPARRLSFFEPLPPDRRDRAVIPLPPSGRRTATPRPVRPDCFGMRPSGRSMVFREQGITLAFGRRPRRALRTRVPPATSSAHDLRTRAGQLEDNSRAAAEMDRRRHLGPHPGRGDRQRRRGRRGGADLSR